MVPTETKLMSNSNLKDITWYHHMLKTQAREGTSSEHMYMRPYTKLEHCST